MVSKEQRKLKKRKQREKDARQKVLARRAELRTKAKEDREEARRERRIDKLQRDLYAMDQHFEKEMLMAAPESTLSQLEKNIEILRALEAEHEKELSAKQELNEELESKGYVTLEEKMEALQQATLKEQMAEQGVGVGGSADCKMSVNTVPTDTAEVSVIKNDEEI